MNITSVQITNMQQMNSTSVQITNMYTGKTAFYNFGDHKPETELLRGSNDKHV